MKSTKVPIALALMLATLAACGDGGDTTPATSGTTPSQDTIAATTAPTAPTATIAGTDSGETTLPSVASGDPVKIGLINLEDSPILSLPEISQGTQAAVDYINNELGGVQGHPIELVVCKAQGSPESSQDCASQMIDEGVLFVMHGFDIGTSGSVPVLEAAGIPLIGGLPLGAPEYSATNAVFFSGGNVSGFPASARYMVDTLKVNEVSVIHTDNDAGQIPATKYFGDVLTAMGVEKVNYVPVAFGAPDVTPAITAAVTDGADAVLVITLDAGCIQYMQAFKSLGVEVPLFLPGGCLVQDVVEQAGSTSEGTFFNSDVLPFTSDDPEVKAYLAAMESYGPTDAKISAFSQVAFSGVMNMWSIMGEVGYANLSSGTILDALRSGEERPSFMAHPYQCTGDAALGAPNVCNTFDRIVRVTDGQPIDVSEQWISGADELAE